MAFFLAVATLGVEAASLTNQPIADTYSETYGSEDKNFASEPVLRIDQWEGRQVFLRFPLENVPPGKRLLRATLRLWVTEIGFNEQGEFPELKTCVGLYDVTTPWTEGGLTFKSPDGVHPWNQGPGIPGGKYGDVGPLPKPDIGVRLRQPAVPLEAGSQSKHSWLELDLSAFTRESLLAGAKEINLLLRSSTLGRNYTFGSRETPLPEQRPQLVLEVADALDAFQVESPIALTWKPGDAVRIPARSAGLAGLKGARWSLEQKPATSRVSGSAVQASETGASLRPDVPGKYRLRLDIKSLF